MTVCMSKMLTVRLPDELDRRVRAFAKPNLTDWIIKRIESGLPRTVDWGAHLDAAPRGAKHSYKAGDAIRRRSRERGA